MKILEEYNKIKVKNSGKIVLLKSGAFYIALGIDAYILSEIIKLKLTNLSNVKRAGVPVNSIKKYVNLMKEYDVPHVVVCNDKVLYEYNGNFDFVIKTERIDKLLGILKIKDMILKNILDIFSKNLGELL